MREELRAKCELLIKNRDIIRDSFRFEKELMSIVAGLIFTGEDREADAEKLKECRKILKKNTGVFSKFRDEVELALLSKMVLSDNPEKYLNDVVTVYKEFVKKKIPDNSYVIQAAALLCEQGRMDCTDAVIERYKELMKLMNDEHPLITSSEDISYVMLLALTDRNIKVILNDIEECITYLKKTCKIDVGSNSTQGLGEVLALTDGDIKSKCDKVFSIYNLFKEKKEKYGTDCEFSALGSLVDIDAEPEVIVEEILEADAFLGENKGFKESKDFDRKKRMMFATILVAESYGKDSPSLSNTFISNSLQIIKAQQTAMWISLLLNALPSIIGGLMVSGESDETKENTERIDQ
ncbi:MAG: DUF4003 domain-containing protein [Lachnospiraceae bacterium]|nr:DUF4003 domain-containing protein [Lachnospiraceae bacterium]